MSIVKTVMIILRQMLFADVCVCVCACTVCSGKKKKKTEKNARQTTTFSVLRNGCGAAPHRPTFKGRDRDDRSLIKTSNNERMYERLVRGYFLIFVIFFFCRILIVFFSFFFFRGARRNGLTIQYQYASDGVYGRGPMNIN